MIYAVDYSIHIVGWNLTAGEVSSYAAQIEDVIKTELLPCNIVTPDEILTMAPTTDILFSFPTEEGLTTEANAPIRFEIKARYSENRIMFQDIAVKAKALELSGKMGALVATWPGRETFFVMVDIN